MSLQRLVRFLEGHTAASNHASGRLLHHDQLPPPPPPPPPPVPPEDLQLLEKELRRKQQQQQQQQQLHHHQHLLELARQKQRGLLRDDLPERPSIIDQLQRQAAREPLEYVQELERQQLLPYLEYEPRGKPYSLEDEARVSACRELWWFFSFFF